MSILGSAASVAAQKAAEAAERERLKKGKNPEQVKVIDFFLGGESGGCGCLGGCLGGSSRSMSMDEYIALVQNKVGALNIREKAIAKIGLDESQIQEIPPIVLSSFIFDDDCHIKVDSSVAVSSQYSITWIFFSSTQMYTYQYIFDTTSDNTWELTKDFFYRDITCFSTEKQVKEKIDISVGKGCLSKGENVTKNHYVVDMLEIIVPGTKYSFSLRNSDTVEQSIQAAKSMLREKKFS